jgi:DNA-binding HxlR family transcriptional regulator
MEHVSFAKVGCPIARSLERVGEWWSILIMRDAINGLTRFDEFQRNLGIAPNMLTRRLKSLVAAGLLERRKYSDKPKRYEYVLTERGRDFRSVLWTLAAWGNKHFAPEGPSLVYVDRETGEWAEPIVVDGRSGEPMASSKYVSAAGPAASRRLRSKFTFRSQKSGSPLKRNEEPSGDGVRFEELANE